MGSVAKIIIGKNKDGTNKILKLDRLLKPELDKVRIRVKKKNWDYVALVAGIPGSGKSTLARTLARYFCRWFDVSYVAFSGDDFIEITNNCPEYSSVILDESFASLNSKVSMSEDFVKIINHLQLIRQKHLFIFLCLPNFFDLAKGISIFRSSHLFVTYADKIGNRGHFLVFDRDNKRKLYVKGGKYMNYNAQKANFYARFWRNDGIIDINKYNTMKEDHMKAQNDKELRRITNKSGRNDILWKLHQEHGWMIKDLAVLAEIKPNTLSEAILSIKSFLLPSTFT